MLAGAYWTARFSRVRHLQPLAHYLAPPEERELTPEEQEAERAQVERSSRDVMSATELEREAAWYRAQGKTPPGVAPGGPPHD